jgi:cold shock CspA family protein
MPPVQRMTGTVVRVLPNKGYAFVRGEDRISRFAHAITFDPISSFDTLHQGQAVEFEPAEDPKGARAVNVKVLGGKK